MIPEIGSGLVISEDESCHCGKLHLPFARGATDGAPQAQQVIDRWHLLKNLREAIERFLSHTQMPEEASEGAGPAILPRQKRTSGERVRSEGSRQRRLALYRQVQELYQQGGTILGIARQLHLGHRRVRNFVRSPNFPEWGKPARTSSTIDPYRAYLQERWQQGCQQAGPLWQELVTRGFDFQSHDGLSMDPGAKGEASCGICSQAAASERDPPQHGSTPPRLAVSA